MRTIIGVVGPTPHHGQEVPREILDYAEAVGQHIADLESIVLTGGEYAAQPKAAKDAAIKGAIDAGTAMKRGRAVGILAGGKPPCLDIVPEPGKKPSGRCLYVHTGLTPHQRNVINGYAPDVLIALGGGPGTLSEIAFAAHARKPLVFLDSLKHLRRVWKAERLKVAQIVEEAKVVFPDLDVETILRGLRESLEQGKDETEPRGAVKHARELASAAIGLRKFPELPDLPSFQDRFNEKFEELIRDSWRLRKRVQVL